MIQSWMSAQAMAACPNAQLRNPPAFGAQGQWWNGMISPLLPLQPDAIVWHQGEENADDGLDYTCLQDSMISDWRNHFGIPHLPFVFVQLQPCGIPPSMRYAQALSLKLPATGMATCTDLGDPDPTNRNGLCHSRYKTECGRRLALEVNRLLPKVDNVSIPVSRGATVIGVSMAPDKSSRSQYSILLTVENGDGMHWQGTQQCTICCGTLAYPMQVLVSSGSWKYVNPKDVKVINSTTLLVSGRWAPGWGPFAPLVLRYNWEDFPQCSLFNSAGLPAPPFNVSIPPLDLASD